MNLRPVDNAVRPLNPVARVIKPAVSLVPSAHSFPAPVEAIVRATRGPRRGFALIELLTVMALLTIILGIGGIAYHDVMGLNSAQAHYRQRRASAEYFLRHFAQDVRSASNVTRPPLPTAGVPTFCLERPDGAWVVYVAEGHTLQRVVATPKQTDQKMPLLSDPGMAVKFDVESRDGRARAVVATVEWEEPPRIGISHPILSLRVALRGQP